MNANIVKIQKFSTHDGPGIRTVVFLKGCPLNCKWCHNPETKTQKPQIFYNENDCINCMACIDKCIHSAHLIENGKHKFNFNLCKGCMLCTKVCPTGACEQVGKDISIDDCLKIIMQDKAFYGEVGGLTISGGEPMFQPDFTIELLKKAKELSLSTAVETCGYFDPKHLNNLCRYSDYLLWDIKDTNSIRHKKFIGVDNELILKNLHLADKLASHIIMRCILINGVNTKKEHYEKLAEIYHSLKHCDGIEILPYHAYGSSKNKMLYGYETPNENWILNDQQLLDAKEYILNLGCKIID